MTWPARQITQRLRPLDREIQMKIKIVKTGSFNAKPSGFCPVFVDDDALNGAKK
jgi:hypothetical protein